MEVLLLFFVQVTLPSPQTVTVRNGAVIPQDAQPQQVSWVFFIHLKAVRKRNGVEYYLTS